MEGIGPEGKRPRLDSYGGPALSHRMQQQSSDTPLHNYSSHALPPPNAYTQPPPPSPYHDVANTEHRSLPEPAQHGYTHVTSGYTTPVRDARSFPQDANYSRHGSVSAPTRSPDDIQQLAQLRPLNTASANEGHHYPPHPQLEHGASQAGYATYDMQTNGNVVHTLPMAGQNDPGHGHAHYSPVNTPSFAQGQGPFSAPPNNTATWLLPKKKNSRAQQVRLSVLVPLVSLTLHRRVTRVETGRRSATKEDLRAASAKSKLRLVYTGKWLLQSRHLRGGGPNVRRY